MSEFIILDKDYIDLIKSEEDLKNFRRAEELLEKMKGVPAKDCIKDIIEVDNILNDLEGIPRRKFIILGDPKLN